VIATDMMSGTNVLVAYLANTYGPLILASHPEPVEDEEWGSPTLG
jgi:hypothetical protein